VQRAKFGRPKAGIGGGSERPDVISSINRIRAELIRFLALGGDALHPVPEQGVMLFGAWITGKLNLHLCRAASPLFLEKCVVEKAPFLASAQIRELGFTGSFLPGLDADGLKVLGNVNMGDGFKAEGEVRLLGAVIGGNLSCSGGQFNNADGVALNADGLKVSGSVNMDDGFKAEGDVRLLGVVIGGDVNCRGGRFSNEGGYALNADRLKVSGNVDMDDGFKSEGEVRLLGAVIGGNLSCDGGQFTNADGNALTADGLKVSGGFFLRDANFMGSVGLMAAHIGTLIDDQSCWKSGKYILDGLHYDRIIGFTDADSRIKWLNAQDADQLNEQGFAPQPWEQLIKVLREMGHNADAAEISIAKQKAMYKAGRIGKRLPDKNDQEKSTAPSAFWTRQKLKWPRLKLASYNIMARGWHRFYGITAGYGHRPSRILVCMVTSWLVCSLLYWAAADHFAVFGPSNPIITSATLYPDADTYCGHGNEPGKQRWTECPGVPDEYSTFQPFIYSLDVILPLIDLQQERDWAPIAEGPTGKDLLMGVVVRWMMWLEILFGWFASLMFVAIISRLVEKD
jgi:hypothetical protein